jgi:hypothetical protein
VFRDDEGDVVTAGAGALKHVRDVFHVEVYACFQGVMAADEKGIANIILEMDSLMLKQALEGDYYRFSKVGGYIFQLKSLIGGSFSKLSCNFVPRSCNNKVAHTLGAKGSLCNHGADILWEFTPPCVNLVASEIAEPLR